MDKIIQSEHDLSKMNNPADCFNIKNFDSLAWRVMNVKQQQDKARKRMAYNLRPRLRREDGETIQ